MKYLTLSFMIFIFFSCAISPTGRRQLKYLPEQQMDAIGNNTFEQLKEKKKINNSARTNEFVNCVVNHVLKANGFDKSKWEAVVFQDDTANAFALPGENIGVNTGIIKIADEQSELAAIIGHEIAHVVAEHGNERMSQALGVQFLLIGAQVAMDKKESQYTPVVMAVFGIAGQGALMKFSRTHETEADIVGQKYMAKAGFDPMGAVSLWNKMAKNSGGSPPEFLSTHPSHDTRIKNLTENAHKVMNLYNNVKNKPNCSL